MVCAAYSQILSHVFQHFTPLMLELVGSLDFNLCGGVLFLRSR